VILLPLGRGTCTSGSATGLLTLRSEPPSLPALAAVVGRDLTNIASQLRGSSGISPLSRASRCHSQRRKHKASNGLKDSSPAFPAKPERPRWASGRSPDLRFSELERLPGFPVALCSSSQRLQLRGSDGFSPRFPIPDGEVISEGRSAVKGD